MKIAVVNNKGGVGKSTIAFNLALELNFLFITNEPRSHCIDVFGKNRTVILKDNDNIDNLDDDLNVIFDFKGSTTGKLIAQVLKKADLIIIPIIYKHQADIFVNETIYTLKEIEKINKKIILIANHISTSKEWTFAKKEMQGLPYPIFRLNRAILLHQTIQTKKSISKYTNNNKLLKHNYRNVIKQFSDLINFIKS